MMGLTLLAQPPRPPQAAVGASSSLVDAAQPNSYGPAGLPRRPILAELGAVDDSGGKVDARAIFSPKRSELISPTRRSDFVGHVCRLVR